MGAGSEKINDMALNALAELGNIGAGNAATSLSVMLSSKLTMSTPRVELVGFDDLENALGGAENIVLGVISQLEGLTQAMLLFVVGMDDAEKLCRAMVGQDMDIDWHSEMGISAIQEVANIIIGSYVASLENLSGLKIRYSQPECCIDMAASILSVPCIEFGKVSDKALLINSSFAVGEDDIDGYIMLVSEMHSFDELLAKLGIGGAVDE